MKFHTLLFFALIPPFVGTACQMQDDTTKTASSVKLSEIVVKRSSKLYEIGLSNQRINSSLQGLTGDKVAVFIPNNSDNKQYIQSIEIAIKEPQWFTEGYVSLYLCEATSISQPPGKKITDKDVKLTTADLGRIKRGQVQIDLPIEIEMPKEGVFVVAEWVYERTGDDVRTRQLRSAKIAGTFDIKEPFTWTSVGDFKNSWQHEGGPNSLSKNIFRGRLYNALLGVVIRR